MSNEYISRNGYQKLCESYIRIDQEINDVLKQVGECAKAETELSENTEYLDLSFKARYTLPDQKKRLYDRQRNAIIIEETSEYENFDGNTVIIGSEVELIIDGVKECYKILGDSEGDPENFCISWKTNLAKAVLGKHIGDSAECNGMEIIIQSVKRI